MSQIEVPDWVVEIYRRTYRENFVDGRLMKVEERVHRAITAALGAWVVPAAWAGADFPNWMRRESEQIRKLTREAQPEHGFTTPLYAMRQEKPE